MNTPQDLIAQLRKDAHHHIDGQMAGLMEEAADALQSVQVEIEQKDAVLAAANAVMAASKLAIDSATQQRDTALAQLTEIKTNTPPMESTQQQPTSPDVKAALLFALWHHQGHSSMIEQPIRTALDIDQYDLTPKQLDIAKDVQTTLAAQPSQAPSPELLLGWTRYEKARKLSPLQWGELRARNLAGENFDEMIDALPKPSTPVPQPAPAKE